MTDADMRRARANRTLAERLLDAGDLAGSAAALRAVLSVEPNDGLVWSRLAYVYAKMRDRDAYALSAERALAAGATRPGALINLSLAALLMGLYAEAMRLAEGAVRAGPSEWGAFYARAMAERALGRRRAAARSVADARALAPERASLVALAATLALERGRRRAAMDLAQTALEMAPESADAHALLGLAHAERGRNAAARPHLATLTRVQPGHPDIGKLAGLLRSQETLWLKPYWLWRRVFGWAAWPFQLIPLIFLTAAAGAMLGPVAFVTLPYAVCAALAAEFAAAPRARATLDPSY